MADERKPPATTRPFPAVRGGTPASKDVLHVTRPTRPIAGPISDKTNPVFRPESVGADPLAAKRREIAKKKRDASLKKLAADEESREAWVELRRWVLLVLAVVACFAAWRAVDAAYPNNQWPLWAVWIVIGTATFGGLGWAIWYTGSVE